MNDKTVTKFILNRTRPDKKEVGAMLKGEKKEWLEHGDCKHGYDYHRLAMEVRYLRRELAK